MDRDAAGRYLAGRPDVLASWLFGSHARGEAGPLSDVDVAVLLDERACSDRFRARLAIIADLSSLLRTAEIDVVVLDEAPLPLAFRVLRDGVVLSCRDRARIIELEWRTATRYFDFQPLLRRYEREVIARAAKGELRRGHHPDRRAVDDHRQVRQRPGAASGAQLR